MQKLITALFTLTLIGVTNAANAYTWPADQLYEESLHAESVAVTCFNKPHGQQQYRRLYINNPDGTKKYINKGNGVYTQSFSKNDDGYELTADCYDLTTGYIRDWDSGYDSQVTKCDNPLAIGNVTKYRKFTKWTSGKLSSNVKTDFNVYQVIEDFKVPELTFTKQSEYKEDPCIYNANGKTITGKYAYNRQYNLYSDGTKKYYTDWQLVDSFQCVTPETKSMKVESCATTNPQFPLGYIEGYHTRMWSPSGVTEWAPSFGARQINYCYNVRDELVKIKESQCPVGQSGIIRKEMRNKVYTYFTGINNFTDYPYLVEIENTCKATGPITVEIKPGSETVSCVSYYGAQQGTYSGNVTKTGDNLTIFDPVSGATNTTFQAKSEDTTSCVKEITATTKELMEEECPAGFLGKITKYLVKAENSTGTVYPYGTTPILESNTCTAVSVSDEVNTPSAERLQDSVLSNLSFTTSSISKSDLIINQLNKIDTSNLENKSHIMNINADNLTSGSFDSTKISNLIKTFKIKLGSQSTSVKLVSAPTTLDKYIGQDGLTQSKILKDRLTLTGTSINDGTVTVKYVSLSTKIPTHYGFTVKVFE